jgi:predicted O-linked N-acetylglucosamine transferase (SPINDLY family)
MLGRAIACHQAGRLDEAEAVYHQILDSAPSHAQALHLLGMLLFQKGRRADGLAHLQRAVESDPTAPMYHLNYGSALAQDGRVDEALVETRKALELAPADPQIHFNLGRLLETSSQMQDAAQAYERAVEIRPDFAAAHNNLGNVLYALGKSGDAVACYRTALGFRPEDSKTHKNLGRALHDLGRMTEAIEAYQRAIELDPNDSEVYSNLGTVLATGRQYDQAIEAYQKALSVRPDDTTAMTNLANALKDIGRVDEAIALLSKALELGADARTGSCLNVLVHLKSDYGPQQIWYVHQWWEEQFARTLEPTDPTFPNDRTPRRRLRVGYVSPSFSDHIVGHCVVALLENHNHQAVEVFCYSDTRREDSITQRLRSAADAWRNIVGMSDEHVAGLIRQDRIDVLVDLNMHMERNRMLVFARKPAPLQITWIGYPSTTGLRTMDYRISDHYLDPRGSSHDKEFYSERTIRLPHSYWCYKPLENLPPANELPATRNGYVTFGCLNSFIKVSDAAMRLWARVLRRVQNSRLLILAPEGSARQRVLEFFQGQRIDPDRIGFLDRSPRREYMELYHQIDLCLDTTPYTGHTTTLDSLWMGVPVVSMTGSTAVSRGGMSILANIGLADYCVAREEDFVEKAAVVADDWTALAELRATLRKRMSRSRLTRGRRFAINMEGAYRLAWRRWCRTFPADLQRS